LVSTTDAVSGYRVTSYLDAIIVPCIGAASQLKDKLAMFTDFTGGRSAGYQKAFGRILESGMSDLKRQARTLGANAVLGLRIETTNISEGKSLLSFLIYGTAVVLEPL
jgi:uncharacterized protein YbjQ (UPF0145 family)